MNPLKVFSIVNKPTKDGPLGLHVLIVVDPVWIQRMDALKVMVSPLKGRLRIRWRYRAKPYVLTPGLADTPENRTICQTIAQRIQADCLLGSFDETLYRYRPWTIGHDAKEIWCVELFERYRDAMKVEKELYQGSLERYNGALSHIRDRLGCKAHEVTGERAKDFVAMMAERVSNRTTKEYLMLIRACFRWADGQYSVPETNPWDAPIRRVKASPKQPIQPFTEDEVPAIIAAFHASPDYRRYADFVSFLFGTGCRLGEAIALEWQHIARDFQTVWIGQAYSHGVLKGTKTGKARTVQLTPTLSAMLHERVHGQGQLVFPAKGGGYLDIRHFRSRAWRKTLLECEIEYRKPYVTRHTAISHALQNGADPVHVASQTGHDLATLYKHYAHVIKPKPIFVEF